MKGRRLKSCSLLAVAALTTVPVSAQVPSNSRYGSGGFMPLAPIPKTGEPVAPFFEGWYRNADGTFTLSFGWFNLNGDQTLDIPIGPDNLIEPAEYNGVQPTHFPGSERRDRGVFHVTVPASWEDGDERVVWTITANGKTESVPGRVGYSALQLDYGPRAMGSVSPVVRFSPNGEEGQHLQGVWSEKRAASVGEAMMITLWGDEVSKRYDHDDVNTDVFLTATWFKHQGPAEEVTFSPGQVKIERGHGRGSTNVTFSAPGEYVLRARVDNWNANDSSGGDQCCWTNAYVPVTVTPGG
jgi:hypothetical protein